MKKSTLLFLAAWVLLGYKAIPSVDGLLDTIKNNEYKSKIGSWILNNTIYDITSTGRRDTFAIFMTIDEQGSRYQNSYQAIQRLTKLKVNPEHIVLYKVPDLFVNNSRSELSEFFSQLVAIVWKEDVVFLYIQWHGTFINQTWSYVWGLSSVVLWDALQHIQSKKIIMINGCWSWWFLDMVNSANNMTVVTSSRDDKESDWNRYEQQKSFFYGLFWILNKNPKLTIEEAYDIALDDYRDHLTERNNLSLAAPGIKSSKD